MKNFLQLYKPFNWINNFYILNDEELIYWYGDNQYMINIKNLKFKPKSGLILCNYLKELCINKKILDYGTGYSALLGKHCINIGAKEVDAIDIDENVIEYNKSTSVEKNLNIFYSDGFKNINKKYDLIVSNPPQLPNDASLHFYHDVGGVSGREVIDEIIENAHKYLKNNGRILLLLFGFLGINVSTNEKEPILNKLKNKYIIEKCDRYVTPIRYGGGIYNNINKIKMYFPNYNFIEIDNIYQNEIFVVQAKLK